MQIISFYIPYQINPSGKIIPPKIRKQIRESISKTRHLTLLLKEFEFSLPHEQIHRFSILKTIIKTKWWRHNKRKGNLSLINSFLPRLCGLSLSPKKMSYIHQEIICSLSVRTFECFQFSFCSLISLFISLLPKKKLILQIYREINYL